MDFDLRSDNWGFSIGPLSAQDDDYSFDIYAAAAQCDLNKGTIVGTVTVNYSGETAVVTYESADASIIEFSEIHLYVGSEPLPTNKRGRYIVKPGRYPIGMEYGKEGVASAVFTVPDLDGGEIFVVPHSVVCPI